jgi:hypothetical protein
MDTILNFAWAYLCYYNFGINVQKKPRIKNEDIGIILVYYIFPVINPYGALYRPVRDQKKGSYAI